VAGVWENAPENLFHLEKYSAKRSVFCGGLKKNKNNYKTTGKKKKKKKKNNRKKKKKKSVFFGVERSPILQ